MTAHRLLVQLGLVLGAGWVGGTAARLLRLPVMIGFVLAGLAIGPHTPGIVASDAVVTNVANIGVILLMFSVGLQFSLREIASVRREAVWGGLGQIAATVLLGMAVARLLGWSVGVGVFVGCAIALSSTAVMVRVLEERGELGSVHGLITLGILVVQDLAVIVMAALLPLLGSSNAGSSWLASLVAGTARAALFIGALLFLASLGVPWVLALVTRLRSRELFVLAVVTICMGAALAAESAGLELALGAFMAGLVVAGSEYADEVLAQIRPLRDVFASVFFVSVGMLLDAAFVLRNWPEVLALVLCVSLGKPIIAAAAVWATGRHPRTALQVGFSLGQIGEFSFVLAGMGVARGIVGQDIASMVLAAAVLSIFLTPVVAGLGVPVYGLLMRSHAVRGLAERKLEPPAQETAAQASEARVLVLGYGRVGRTVSEGLRKANVLHLVVDYDTAAARHAEGEGIPVIYGDASSEAVLSRALTPGVELAVVALPEAPTTEMVVRTLRKMNPRLHIIARVHRLDDRQRILDSGADAAICPETLAGTEMLKMGLAHLGVAVRPEEWDVREVAAAPE